MTENKHFTIEKSFIAEDTFCIRDNSGKFSFPITPDKSELIMYQKALNELKEENEQLRMQLSEQGTQIDFLKDENHHMKHVLNENKQLKQRNTNQYQQLNQLWQLIEAKDWETLTAMNNQMKEDEKQLQREMRCYK